jgi:ubiquitin-activating enzyme E1
MNTAIPLWLFSEPLSPTKMVDKDYDPIMMGPVKAIPAGWTSWDSILV